MDPRIPPASVDWQKGVTPEVVDEIMRLPRAVVQMPGCPEVIYVNCCEGGATVPLLHQGDQLDLWLEVPNQGGPGGGAQHPRGVILIGPAGVETLLSKVEAGVHPDCNTSTDKLRQGRLRLLPPTPFLKMCGVYRHKMNAYKVLRVVRTGRSVFDYFQYRQQLQQANQGHTPQQQTPQPQAPASNSPPGDLAQQSSPASSPPSADLDQHDLQPASPPSMMPPQRTPQTLATTYHRSTAAPPTRMQPAAGRAPTTSRADTQPGESSFYTAVPPTKLEETPTSAKAGTHAGTSSKRGLLQGAADGTGRPGPSTDDSRDGDGTEEMDRSSKRRRVSQMQEQIQEWEQAEQRANHIETRAQEAQHRELRQQRELAELQQRVKNLDAQLKSTARERQELQKQAQESREAEDTAYKKLPAHRPSPEP